MKILVTGATGFIGTFLSKYLHDNGHSVYGTHFNTGFVTNLEPVVPIKIINCDIRNKDHLTTILSDIKPQRIYHLAAQSLPTVSWKEPILTMDCNVAGTINLYEAIIKLNFETRVLIACSSAEYGIVTEDQLPVKESHNLKPIHPYGISKVAQELLAYQYWINNKIPSTIVRIFNTTGPGKTNDACSDFVRRIVQIERGEIPPTLYVGNTETRRDITDVRDTALGLYLAMENGDIAEAYNLCSGRIYLISDIIRMLLKLTITGVKTDVSLDLLRPSDEPIIWGDNFKIKQKTGWTNSITMEQTLIDMLHYWRNKKP